MTRVDVNNAIKLAIAKETGISETEIQDGNSFFELGLDSVTCIFVMEQLENVYNIQLNPISFWDHPTVGQFTTHVYDIING